MTLSKDIDILAQMISVISILLCQFVGCQLLIFHSSFNNYPSTIPVTGCRWVFEDTLTSSVSALHTKQKWEKYPVISQSSPLYSLVFSFLLLNFQPASTFRPVKKRPHQQVFLSACVKTAVVFLAAALTELFQGKPTQVWSVVSTRRPCAALSLWSAFAALVIRTNQMNFSPRKDFEPLQSVQHFRDSQSVCRWC